MYCGASQVWWFVKSGGRVRKTDEGQLSVNWYQTVFELIDMRSFSNLWYWIALAVSWSTVSHLVLGVPYDVVLRARRDGGQAEEDFHDLLRININRITYIVQVSGVWLLALVCGLLTMLGMLGFWYWIEFAQAVFLLAFPMSLVGLLSVRTAQKIVEHGEPGEVLYTRMRHHRQATQVIGMASIFVTSIWGMYQNIGTGALGTGF